MSKSKSGFTIIELLIVIVVIGILASITIVAYNGNQKRARDAKRMDDVGNIVKGLQTWALGTASDFNNSNAGSGGTSVGWFDNVYSPYLSVKGMLVSGGYLSDGVVDPINSKSGTIYAYMISLCISGETRRRVILARLENPPAQTLAEQLGTTCTNSSYNTWTTAPYSMNYARMAEL